MIVAVLNIALYSCFVVVLMIYAMYKEGRDNIFMDLLYFKIVILLLAIAISCAACAAFACGAVYNSWSSLAYISSPSFVISSCRCCNNFISRSLVPF